MVTNMTVGNPLKHILIFAIPLFIGNVFQQVYNIADTVIVGRIIGAKALGAVAASGAIVFMVFCVCFGLTSGFAIITAQRFGAGDTAGVRRSVFTGTLLTVLAIIIVSAISLPTVEWTLEKLATPSELLDDAITYLQIIYFGIAPVALYNLLAGYVRALGDSRTPLIFLIAATVVNVFLDLYFIKVLGWGIAGAAWATVIAQSLSTVACFVYVIIRFPILRLKKEDMVWEWKFAFEHLRVGTPMAAQFIIIAIGLIILQAGVNPLGADIVIGIGAAGRIQQLIVQPLVSLGLAMATFSAQNYGAGKLERIKTGVRQTLLISVIISLVSSLLLWCFAAEAARLFLEANEEHIIEYIVKYLRIITVAIFILAALFIYRNTLQGMGRTFIPFLSSVLELVARVVVVYWLVIKYGFTGACLVEPAAWISAAVLLGGSYYTIVHNLQKKQKLCVRSETACAERNCKL